MGLFCTVKEVVVDLLEVEVYVGVYVCVIESDQIRLKSIESVSILLNLIEFD